METLKAVGATSRQRTARNVLITCIPPAGRKLLGDCIVPFVDPFTITMVIINQLFFPVERMRRFSNNDDNDSSEGRVTRYTYESDIKKKKEKKRVRAKKHDRRKVERPYVPLPIAFEGEHCAL